MSNGDDSYKEIYDRILLHLNELGASDVVTDIRATVARGKVRDADRHSAAKTVREMEGKEALAVAIELLASLLEVPFMIESTRKTFATDEVHWEPEETDTSVRQIVSPNIELDDLGELRSALQKLARLAQDLDITLPEIA